ncbi:MAG: DUF296 domain-containing protein [Halobacteriovoraceae bacterium]|nr:DUF296 domain-containing protein [Halobacteriovoraceae bacterium]
MDFIKEQNNYFIRMDRGEEIFSHLLKLAEKEKWQSGHLSGIGAVKDIELGVYELENKAYKKEKITKVMELLSLNGNLSFVDNKPFFHIHGALADSDYKCFGGHFFSLSVAVTCEVIFRPFPKKIIRSPSKEIGINLLDFCPIK